MATTKAEALAKFEGAQRAMQELRREPEFHLMEIPADERARRNRALDRIDTILICGIAAARGALTKDALETLGRSGNLAGTTLRALVPIAAQGTKARRLLQDWATTLLGIWSESLGETPAIVMR